MRPHPEIRLLLLGIEEGYRSKAWYGTNLRGAIRGITAREAAKRPARNRHNIWEIVVHCAYWKYIVRRRLTGEQRGSFPMKGSNWFARPGELSEAAWKRDIRLLDEMHRLLIDAAASLSPADLRRYPNASKFDNRSTMFGIAAHDIYHTGQIQLVKRCIRGGRS